MLEEFWNLFCAFGRLYLIALAVTFSLGALSAASYPFVGADAASRTIVQFNLVLSGLGVGVFGYCYWHCRDYYRDAEREGWDGAE